MSSFTGSFIFGMLALIFVFSSCMLYCLHEELSKQSRIISIIILTISAVMFFVGFYVAFRVDYQRKIENSIISSDDKDKLERIQSDIDGIYLENDKLTVIIDNDIIYYRDSINKGWIDSGLYFYADWIEEPSLYNYFTGYWFLKDTYNILLLPLNMKETLEEAQEELEAEEIHAYIESIKESSKEIYKN